MTIPAQITLPDQFSKVVAWIYLDQIGEGQPVEVYAWPRLTWQFTGDNVGDCELDIYGTNEGVNGLCWGLLATLTMPIKDRMHDPFYIGHDGPITRAVKPVLRGTVDPLNSNAVILFCTKLFAPIVFP